MVGLSFTHIFLNVAYLILVSKAIYLVKKKLRSKINYQALNEIEIVYSQRRMKNLNQFQNVFINNFKRILDDLKKKLFHQWDFVKMQAEAQFK